MSGEAILSAENSGKPLGGRDSTQNPAGVAHSAPSDPLDGGEGLLPPPQEPYPHSQPSDLRSSPVKNPRHALDFVKIA